MLERLATAIHSSLTSSRTSLNQFLPFGTHSIAMTRLLRQKVAADFFTPERQKSERRERGYEQTRRECNSLGIVQCRDWSCIVHHSLWFSRRTCLLLQEFSPRRERSSRRPSATAPHADRWRFTRQRLPTHALLLRYASGTSSLPGSSHSAATDTNLTTPLDTVLRLADHSDYSPAMIDFGGALAAYKSALSSGAIDKLSLDTILAFFGKILSLLEKGRATDEPPLLKGRGREIRDFLQQLQSRAPFEPLTLRSHLCLLVRAHCLAGDVQLAMDILPRIGQKLRGLQQEPQALKAYEGVIIATQLHFGDSRTLDLILFHWENVASYLTNDLSKWHFTTHKVYNLHFRKRLYSLLADISDPVSILRDHPEWDPVNMLRAAELLIMSLCSQKLAHDADDVYSEGQKLGLKFPRKVTLILVRTLVVEDMFERANTLFASVVAQFSHTSLQRYYLCTGLQLAAHQGKNDECEDFFRRISELPGGTANSDTALLMFSYAKQGRADDAVAIFEHLFPPDGSATPTATHYSIIIFGYSQKGDLLQMNSWLENMTNAGFQPDSYVYSSILRSFALRGDLDSIAAALEQMCAAGVSPCKVGYTTIISLLANRRDPIGAEMIYKRAISEGVVPDRRMITAVLDAHVEAGSWLGAIRAFDYLNTSPARHLRLSIEVYNTLLKAYVLIGAPFRVVSRLFSRLEQANVRPDSYTFSLLIQSACDAGYMDVAADIFAEMEQVAEQRQSALHIDVYVLTILMAGYLRKQDKVRAKHMYDEMQKRGIQPSPVTFNAILSAYGNEKSQESFQIAEDFLKSLMSVEPADRVWNVSSGGRKTALELVYGPLMNSYAREQRPEDVERLFQRFLDNGGEPSIGILTALLNVYRRTFNIEAVLQVWPQLFHLGLRYTNPSSLFKDAPDEVSRARLSANFLCIPLSIYIDALSAAGLHNKIGEVWQKFQIHGFTFDSHNWNHLIVCLVRGGELERAFEVLERVILPYREQTAHLLAPRDSRPDSPLTFFSAKPPFNGPSQEPPMHDAKRRARASRKLSRKLSRADNDEADELEARTDFVHPLHVLHRISPAWNTWQPHEAVLSILLLVLNRLEEGLLVSPVLPRGQQPDEELESRARREMAFAILSRIYHNYPAAVRAVHSYELRERRRLRSNYGSTYNWNE